MTRAELDWFYGGGAGRFWPEPWRGLRADGAGGGAARPDRRLSQAALRAGPGRADPLRAGLGGVGERAGGARPRRGARLSLGRLRAGLRAAGEPLLHQRRLSRRRRACAAEHARIAAGARAHRAGPLRHDLPAAHRAGAARGLAGLDAEDGADAGHALSEPGISAELVAVMDGLRG